MAKKENKNPTPKKAGRKAHEPTRERRNFVKMLMGAGFTQMQTANTLEIDHKTLTKYYGEEIKFGKDQANAQIAQAIFRAGAAGNVQAGIFWSKVHMGWRDNSEPKTIIEITPQKIEAPVIEGECVDLDAVIKQ